MKEKRKQRVKSIQKLKKTKDPEALLATWEAAQPWQKGLILREKCVKFIEKENRNSLKRRNARDLVQTAVLLEQTTHHSLNVPEPCQILVPGTPDEKAVDKVLLTLEKELNYYSFVQMLDELGLPREKIISPSTQLKQMALDFSDS